MVLALCISERRLILLIRGRGLGEAHKLTISKVQVMDLLNIISGVSRDKPSRMNSRNVHLQTNPKLNNEGTSFSEYCLRLINSITKKKKKSKSPKRLRAQKNSQAIFKREETRLKYRITHLIKEYLERESLFQQFQMKEKQRAQQKPLPLKFRRCSSQKISALQLQEFSKQVKLPSLTSNSKLQLTRLNLSTPKSKVKDSIVQQQPNIKSERNKKQKYREASLSQKIKLGLLQKIQQHQGLLRINNNKYAFLRRMSRENYIQKIFKKKLLDDKLLK